jgi:DNA replication protein DnaD
MSDESSFTRKDLILSQENLLFRLMYDLEKDESKKEQKNNDTKKDWNKEITKIPSLITSLMEKEELYKEDPNANKNESNIIGFEGGARKLKVKKFNSTMTSPQPRASTEMNSMRISPELKKQA